MSNFLDLKMAAITCARMALLNCPAGDAWVPLSAIEAAEGSNKAVARKAARAAHVLANRIDKRAGVEPAARSAAYAADVSLATEIQYARRDTVLSAQYAVLSAYGGADRVRMWEECQRILTGVGLECPEMDMD